MRNQMCESQTNDDRYVAIATTKTLLLCYNIYLYTVLPLMMHILDALLTSLCRWAYGVCLWEIFSVGKLQYPVYVYLFHLFSYSIVCAIAFSLQVFLNFTITFPMPTCRWSAIQ